MNVQKPGIKEAGWTAPQKESKNESIKPIITLADCRFGDMYRIIKARPI